MMKQNSGKMHLYDKNRDVLALDFDGVIANSISECLVVGHNAFAAFKRRSDIIDELGGLDEQRIAESKRLRNFIRSGEDYVYINLAIEKKADIQNQADFDHFTEKFSGLRPTFFDIFYRERERFSNEQRQKWIQLNPLYAGIKEFLRRFSPKDHLFIITTKKIYFVNLVLSAQKITLPESHLFHANSSIPKKEIISGLLKSHRIAPQHFYFVDDQVDTLLKVRNVGVHCIFAEWGYNNTEQKEKALQAGITSMTLNEFYKYFQGD
ncbi:MAG: hypothetical protein GWP06_11135 [Actinobacteria bacterium]|nr:hypothetical protein [Actinomycetota bacterium]